MQSPWIFSSTFLPCCGESIDFMLADRAQPIHGTFADGTFHSRWADYGADRVQSWRGSEPDVQDAPAALHSGSSTGSFVATLRRLATSFGLSRSGANKTSVRRRRTANPGTKVSPLAVVDLHIANARVVH